MLKQTSMSSRPSSKLGNEIVSDLSLQMSLFFNVCYFPAWLVVSVGMTSLKYDSLNYLYKFILVTILIAVTVIEATRLYLGYLGNLKERVSNELSFTSGFNNSFGLNLPQLIVKHLFLFLKNSSNWL